VKEEDASFGSRLTLNYNVSDQSTISYVFNSINSDHDKTTNGDEPLNFTQNSISTGMQFSSQFGKLEYAVGATYDYFKTPKTGEYIEAEGKTYDDYGLFVTMDYSIDDNFSAFANASRKSRFPTMRESYDEALKKYKYNPDLKPETGVLSEVGIAYISFDFSAQASFFANMYDDMIEKVKVAGDPDKRKMRDNLSEATIMGVDLSVAANISKFKLGGYITYMSGDGKLDGEDVELNNKPEILSGIHLSYSTSFGLLPQIELDYRGKQYEDGIEIDGAAYLNFRLSYTFTQSSVLLPEIFIRVNNIFDTFRYSQLGMPEAGRSISGGVSLRI
jgi:iron complex outermembrane receptor protein